jgi:predicted amino acid dehydrogenase
VRTAQTPWFTFLVHPRHILDVHTFRGSSIVRQHSATEEEYVAKVCTNPPLVSGEVSFGPGGIRGEVIAVVRTPELILCPEGAAQVLAAVQLAAQRGSPVVGLGALTAPVTRGGERLVRKLPPGVTLTNGNAYTAVVVRQNVDEAVAALALSRPARVAVVGCTGSVGSLATRLLDEQGYDLTLIGPTSRRVARLFPDFRASASMSEDVDDVRTADVVVLLTGHPTARVTPGMLQPGTVVIDVAHPANVAPHDYESFRLRGCQVVEGGLVRIPHYACTQEFHLPDRRDTFACLAETYLFSREGIRDHSVGRPSIELARRIERAAKRHAVAPRPLGLDMSDPARRSAVTHA